MKHVYVISSLVISLLTSPSIAEVKTKPFSPVNADALKVTTTPICDSTEKYALSNDYTRLAFLVEKGNKTHLVVNGKMSKGYSSLTLPFGLDFYGPKCVLFVSASNANAGGKSPEPVEPMFPCVKMVPEGIKPNGLRISPDGNHWAFGAQGTGSKQNQNYIVIDGKALPTEAEVITKGIKFSTDGSIVKYSVKSKGAKGKRNTPSRLVINNVKSPLYYFISYFQASPDLKKALFAMCTGDPRKNDDLKPRVVLFENKEFRDLGVGSGPILSTDGKKLSYISNPQVGIRPRMKPGEYYPNRILIDENGNKQELKNCYHFTFSPDGSRYAYVSRKDKGGQIVIDGKPGATFKRIDGTIIFSQDSSRLAFVATTDSGKVLIVDGKTQTLPAHLQHIPSNFSVFSPKGRLIYPVGNRGSMKMFIDGKYGKEYHDVNFPFYSKGTDDVLYFADNPGEMAFHRESKIIRLNKGYTNHKISPNGKDIASVGAIGLGRESKGYELLLNSKRITVLTNKSRAYGKEPTEYAFTPDGAHIVSIAERDNQFILQVDGVDAFASEKFLKHSRHRSSLPIPSFGFLPDGRISAFAVKDNKIIHVVVEIKD